MKKHIINLRLLGLIVLLIGIHSSCFHKQIFVHKPEAPHPSDDIYNGSRSYASTTSQSASYQVFYDELSPYGSWIDYPAYGYVWIPKVSIDFHPYATHGHWVMTNYGWTWVSDFRWGWAAFHYGRWVYETHYGWIWIPDNVWGPAWVDWLEYDDYFGWAPLAPSIHVTVTVRCPFDHYRFVPRRYFTHRHIYNYYVDRYHSGDIFHRAMPITETHTVNNRPYQYGPRKDIVEKAVGQPVREAKIDDNPKPDKDIVEQDRVRVYRPRIDNQPANAPKPKPQKIVPASDIQPVPADKRLTPSVRKDAPNTEGGDNRPQEQVPRRDDAPRVQPPAKEQQRTEERPPRRDDVPREQPPAKEKPLTEEQQPRREDMPREQPPKTQPPVREQTRPQDKLPRRDDVPKAQPPAKEQPRPKVNQPRKTDVPQDKPAKAPPKTEKSKEKAPVKNKSRDNDNEQ